MNELKEKIARAMDCSKAHDFDELAGVALRAIEEAGYVVVPKETLYEIANRAANFMDPDAAEWMPSIYSIACAACGQDATPLLKEWAKQGNLEEPRG